LKFKNFSSGRLNFSTDHLMVAPLLNGAEYSYVVVVTATGGSGAFAVSHSASLSVASQ
jgi:hypothetical protein